MQPGTLINGNPEPTVQAVDRGFLYGDGLFETIAVLGGRVPLWTQHWQRLTSGARQLGLPIPQESAFLADMAQLLGKRPQGDAVLRLQYTAGVGGAGLARPEPALPTRVVRLIPFPERPARHWRDGVRLHLCKTRLAHQPCLAGIKHCNRLEYVVARQEWQDDDTPEGLILDVQGHVAEGTISNVFAVRDGRLLSPDLQHCGVHGVMRASVLHLAQELGLPVDQGSYRLEDWLAADELFLTNSLIGIWPVRALGDKTWRRGPITIALQKAVASAGLARMPGLSL